MPGATTSSFVKLRRCGKIQGIAFCPEPASAALHRSVGQVLLHGSHRFGAVVVGRNEILVKDWRYITRRVPLSEITSIYPYYDKLMIETSRGKFKKRLSQVPNGIFLKEIIDSVKEG